MIKKIIFSFCCLMASSSMFAQNAANILLNPPDTNRGLPVMKALLLRASAKEFDTTSLKLQDLSDLLWAANGVNRPNEGKRTAPSAVNAQDIDIYVFTKSGAYLYNAVKQELKGIVAGDYRDLFSNGQLKEPYPALICLLVSDMSRFKFGEDAQRKEWAAMDAGIVSENISVFCSSVGLLTRPRASMNKEKEKEILKLKDTQYPILNHPVSYKK